MRQETLNGVVNYCRAPVVYKQAGRDQGVGLCTIAIGSNREDGILPIEVSGDPRQLYCDLQGTDRCPFTTVYNALLEASARL